MDYLDCEDCYIKNRQILENKKGIFYVAGSRHYYIVFLAGALNRYGVPCIDALALCGNLVEETHTSKEINNTVISIYTKYKKDFHKHKWTNHNRKK